MKCIVVEFEIQTVVSDKRRVLNKGMSTEKCVSIGASQTLLTTKLSNFWQAARSFDIGFITRARPKSSF